MEMDQKSILSIKIVSVDYYMCFPINNLDITHSEFRQSTVKQVPVIRIFGITQNKKKICANVHGCLPYFYIPCAETCPEKIQKLMSDLAKEIDMNVNVSFGQSNSSSQHVFRVSLVKGIPMYGYHHSEHQFFKIQCYNPNLMRRISNLLQSGAILNKSFQPHESHIPYILKFFIDYNLFGMSYLHVPLSHVHTRDADDKTKFKKRSVSQLEVDFKAIFILNRLAAEEDNTNKAANPGIESLWEDERLRRNALESDSVPPLIAVASQVNECLPTESDIFFRTLLKDALSAKSNELQAEASESERETTIPKKTYDLKNLLDCSVYAAEFSPSSLTTTKCSQTNIENSSSEDTIKNLEDQFLNFSESPDDEAKEVEAAVLESPDAWLDDCCTQGNFESDSLLAPLTQIEPNVNLNQTLIKEQKNSPSEEIIPSDESDDEMFNELNMTIANMEVFSQYVDEEEEDVSIPQLDGIDDEVNSFSPTEITLQQDIARNLYPQPGPSSLFIPPVQLVDKANASSPNTIILNSQKIKNDLSELARKFTTSPSCKDVLKVDMETSQPSDEDLHYEDDDQISSFYNQTMMIDDFISEEEVEEDCNIKEELVDTEHRKDCIITPAIDPPETSEVLERLKDFNIPQFVNPSPFYSSFKDLATKKEVGFNVLEIRGNRMSDLEEFKSCLAEPSEVFKSKAQRLLNQSHKESVVITPYENSPSFQDAIVWLKTNAGDEKTQPLDESPIKEKRERTLMVLDIEEDLSEDLDATLKPSTPTSPDCVPSSQEKATISIEQYIEEGLQKHFRKRKTNVKKSFSKRFQEIMKAKAASSMEGGSDQSIMSPADESEKFSNDEAKVSQSSNSSDGILSDFNSTMIVKNANVQEDLSFNNSDVSGPSLNNTYGFKMKLESLKSNDEHTDLTILAMELHVQTRKELKPNPEYDAVAAIFYSLDGYCSGSDLKNLNGIISCIDSNNNNFRYVKQGVDVLLVKTELALFEAFLHKIRDFDPDIFAGYEIETASWGYFIQRGYILSLNLNNALSRMPTEKTDKTAPAFEEEDLDRGDYFSEQMIPGRIMLDVWRLMKHEISLTSYSFENICYHVLHRRYPKHSFSFLTKQWIDSLRSWIVLDYYVERARTLIEILKQLDLIGRTCELAKLFGIQFYEVLSRGSQFRVESMMIRIAKRRNYVPVSPSVQQRAHMRSPEYIPLILEPESRFYSDPVIVLDFQSLYPSIIIAYNYCFATCLGRVEHLSKASSHPFEFGAYQLRVTPEKLQQLLEKDLVTVSPCGVAFVKESVKEGVLPRMLREILDTRLMVKQSMKIHKNSSALQRLLHSRQLGLKLIANVTYGYTAANFSGRMPAAEVGDSVVSKGRETLERAIKMVESRQDWNCRVCYGDTDSMFVLVPGRTREEAFKIGEQIAEAVTKENPHPIKLKLEKVYQPCILQTKKRYVGFMYETADQKDPVFEAKGIETVRRDGCPAAAKILEKTLRILFETCDVSKVKEYVCRQFTKILSGRCSIQDLTFAKEFRGINGYKEKASVPALILTRKSKLVDPRDEPRRCERVPFVVVNGAPGLPLFRLVRSPLEVLQDENYKINSIYYITKAIIPPLNRCLLLLGANAFDWFTELPRNQQFIPLMTSSTSLSIKKGTISQFFSTTNCATCDKVCHQKICLDCQNDSQKTALALSEKIQLLEQKSTAMRTICESCCRRSFETECISLNCPVIYTSTKVKRDHQQIHFYRDILDEF